MEEKLSSEVGRRGGKAKKERKSCWVKATGRAAGVEGRQKMGKWNRREITGDKEKAFGIIH